MDLAVQSAANEHVTGEERQGQVLASILPSAGDGLEWKKHFMAFVGKHPGNWFLVLMTRVQSMPLQHVSVSE